MVVIGVDLHKHTHTVVATDENGRQLAEKTVAATNAGHLDLVRWAGRFAERRWALEDCRHLSRRPRPTSSSPASRSSASRRS